jgi:aspartyl-tRNA(Asn)/glutamyl-tRNA(Gln) amidotransferase subunit C
VSEDPSTAAHDGAPAAPNDDSPAVTRAEVAHLARLARLAVTEEELDLFAGQLDVILRSIARISEVAAADIEPTSHAVPLQNVLRSDEVAPCLPRDVVLAGAPAVEDDRFRVPQILGEEE